MECKICRQKAKLVKTMTLMERHEAEYYLCDGCGFLFVGNVTWLAEAYREPIGTTDTGYVLRNVYLSRKTLVLFSLIFGSRATFLDYAGGYGMLARLMRDYGLEFFCYDPHTPNLFMKGIEYNNQSVVALTCFECFEHFDSPIEEIEKMLKISKNIFFSTQLLPKDIPDNDWEYYAIKHGQHISFYSLKTLSYLAKKYNLNLCSNGMNLHMLTKKKVPNWLFKIILSLTSFQIDVIVRKMLISKTTQDSLNVAKLAK